MTKKEAVNQVRRIMYVFKQNGEPEIACLGM
jgi:hypothetical protein